jgi:hypothetical protein
MEGAAVPPQGATALDTGAMITAGFRLYGRFWPLLMAAVAAIVIPAQLIVWAIVKGTLSSDAQALNGTIYTSGSLAPAEIAIIGLGFISAILAWGTVSRMLVEAYTGHTTSFTESLSYVSRNFVGLAILAIVAGIGLFVGYVLIIIPGIFLTIAWCVAVPALVFEDTGVFGSLQRSWDLVKNNWWSTFIALLPTVLIVIAVSVALGKALSGSASSNSINSILWLGAAGRAIGAILTYPLIAAITTVIYVNLRVKKEGLTPAQLSQASAPEGPPRQ